MTRKPVAALFVRRDSVYKTLPGVDAWDADRDARLWHGGCPVIAHPPCAQWGRLRHLARDLPDEKALAPLAVGFVRHNGGVLEHPARSTLWDYCGLPNPRFMDHCGGWTLAVSQKWWGHRAEKLTWLYIVGCGPSRVPAIAYTMGEAEAVVDSSLRSKRDRGGRRRAYITKAEREHTPRAFAEWLVDLARRCRVPQQEVAA